MRPFLVPPSSDKPEEIQLSEPEEENHLQGDKAELRAAPHCDDPRLQEPGLPPQDTSWQAGKKTACCYHRGLTGSHIFY